MLEDCDGDSELLACGKIPVEHDVFRHVRGVLLCLQGFFGTVFSVELGSAAGRFDEIEEEIDSGGFAGSICTQEAINLSRLGYSDLMV